MKKIVLLTAALSVVLLFSTVPATSQETEISTMIVHHPDIVHPDRAKQQSGENMKRLDHIPYAYTAIWWYASYPNHYAGDGSHASTEIGELLIESEVNQLVTLVRTLKQDDTFHRLQNRFYNESENPLRTKQ